MILANQATGNEGQACTVSQINLYIKNMFLRDYALQRLCVKGEVSNCKYHSSGHIYFTIKDKASQLSCVMFSTYRKNLGFRLQEGQNVIVQGNISVYERDGKYQMYAVGITQEGAGQLYEEYEKLKNAPLKINRSHILWENGFRIRVFLQRNGGRAAQTHGKYIVT